MSSPLPTPEEIKRRLPATSIQAAFIEKSRRQLRDILHGRDDRLLLIVGPCSIHDTDAALLYAEKFRDLAQRLSGSFFLVMRTYFEKARTAYGWKGLLLDPQLDGGGTVEEGIFRTRKLLLELAKMQVPAAAELLSPFAPALFGDLLSYGCIGARTTESQTHREIASNLPMPVGFKNNTDGNVKVAINGILSANRPHDYITVDDSGNFLHLRSPGNRDAHLVLRGGESGTNYDPRSIEMAVEELKEAGLNPALLVDCSHDNSNRRHSLQPAAFQSLINQIIEGGGSIRGLLLESYLAEGKQEFDGKRKAHPEISITDSCIDWEMTEQLLLWAANKLENQTADYASPLVPL